MFARTIVVVRVCMINYTERLTRLMQDVVTRVPTLSFIDMADVLVFARGGRSNADGPFATCARSTVSEQSVWGSSSCWRT